MIWRTSIFFFFNDTATTEIYTLSLHDALPISPSRPPPAAACRSRCAARWPGTCRRSEEHTSELQSQSNLVCRLLLEKKKKSVTNTAARTDHPVTVVKRDLTNNVRRTG